MNDLEIIKLLNDALSDKKADDIKILDIHKISVLGDYFVIASGNNVNQLQAMEDAVDEVMYKNGYHQKQVEALTFRQLTLIHPRRRLG